MEGETKTIRSSGTPWKHHYERACEAANASVQTYVRSSAHMILNLKGPSESKRLRTFCDVSTPAATATGKPTLTTNIFGDPLQISNDGNQFILPPAANSAGFTGGDVGPEGRLKTVFQVERHPDFAPVVSSAQKITAVPASTAEIPDYLARPLAVQLGLVADEEISKREHVEVTKLKAATSALEDLQLVRKETNHEYLLQSVFSKAADEESPSQRREAGLLSRHPLAVFQRVDDPIGHRVPSDGWRGGVQPSLGADLRYAPTCGLDPGNITSVSTRWFKHKRADRQEGKVATGRAETDEGRTEKSVPAFLPMLHQLCRQPMRVDREKRLVVTKEATSRSVVVKGQMVPVEEETTAPPGSPEVTIIRQQGMEAVVERLQFDAPPTPPARLPRKQKSTKELGIQTEPQRAPARGGKASTKILPARVESPLPRRERVTSERSPSPSTEDSTLDTGETLQETDVSVCPASQSGRHFSAAPDGKSEENEGSSRQSSLSKETPENAFSDKSPSLCSAAWQQPLVWWPPATWNLMQRDRLTAVGIPNPVGPPNLQAPEAEQAEAGIFCVHPLTVPEDVLTAAFMPFVGVEQAGGGTTAETDVPDPQRAPDLRKPASEVEPQHEDVTCWLNEEAKRLFPPGFEQMLWESVLLQNPPEPTGFPVVQFTIKELTNPWQTVCEEAQWEEQWRLYQQWHRQWQQQAYVEAVSGREDALTERQCDVNPTSDDCRSKQIKEAQQLVVQEISKEFDSFTRTQQSLGRTVGAQSYRGRAAIGNCRGGRRAWGVFDRTMRTSAERTRQRKMKMLPEVDDCFDTVPFPSLRRSAREAGRVRGGLRRRSVPFATSDLGGLRRLHGRGRRAEERQEDSTRTSHKECVVESSSNDQWWKPEGKSRSRHSGQKKTVHVDKMERDATDPENEQTRGNSGEPIDWYDRERLRLYREKKMDTILAELADYFKVPKPNSGETLRVDLGTVSHRQDSEERPNEHEGETKLRSVLSKSAALKLTNRLHASETITELKRMSGLLAAERLPCETEAFLRAKLRGLSRRQQLFVGLLNVEGSNPDMNSSCIRATALAGCQPLRQFFGKHLKSDHCVADYVVDTTRTEYNSGNTEADADTGVNQISGASQVRDENSEALPCNEKEKAAGSGLLTAHFGTAEQPDDKTSPGLRARTLLDLSAATAFEEEHLGEVDPCQARLAHHRSPCRQLRSLVSCISRFEADATPACDRSSRERLFPEDWSLTHGGAANADRIEAVGNCQARITNSGSFVTNDGASCTRCPTVVEKFDNPPHAGSSASCVTSARGKGASEDERRCSVISSNSPAGSNTMSGSAATNSESACTECNYPLQRDLPADALNMKDRAVASPRRPVLVAESGNNEETFVTVHCLRHEVDRPTLPPVEMAPSAAHEIDKFAWKRHLDQWRTVAKNESHILFRRARPTSFPWDEDVIPTCRGKREAMKSRAGGADTGGDILNHSDSVRTEFFHVIRKGASSSDINFKATRRRLSKLREERRLKAFLRRQSGTGGGHYARGTGRRNSQVEVPKRENTCTPVANLSSTDVTSKRDLGNAGNSCPQPHTKAHCFRLALAGKGGVTTYSVERAFVLANFGHLHAGDVSADAENVIQASADTDTRQKNYCGSQLGAVLGRKAQTGTTLETRDGFVKPTQPLSMCDRRHGNASRRTRRCESGASEHMVGEPGTTALHRQGCLKMNKHIPECALRTARASPSIKTSTMTKKKVHFQSASAGEEQVTGAEEGPKAW